MNTFVRVCCPACNKLGAEATCGSRLRVKCVRCGQMFDWASKGGHVVVDANERTAKLGRATEQTQESPVLVSMGYEGRSFSSFLGTCQSAGITTLVDVRLTPWSRKKGFSKTMLEVALNMRGIQYLHEPTLGNPKDNRDAFRAGDDGAKERFQALLTQVGSEALERVLDLAQVGPVGILCYERDEAACHRYLVIRAVATRTETLTVVTIP